MLEVRDLVQCLKLSVIMITVCVNSRAYDTYYDIRTTIRTITSGTCLRIFFYFLFFILFFIFYFILFFVLYGGTSGLHAHTYGHAWLGVVCCC